MTNPFSWKPLAGPGQAKVGDQLRFTIGDKPYCETVKAIIDAGTAKEELVYNKKANYYLITSMVADKTSNAKNVMVRSKDAPTGKYEFVHAATVEEIVSDDELDAAFANANFGGMTKREVVRLGALKCMTGYRQGHTSKTIGQQLGLITDNYNLTRKGRMYLWLACKNGGDV